MLNQLKKVYQNWKEADRWAMGEIAEGVKRQREIKRKYDALEWLMEQKYKQPPATVDQPNVEPISSSLPDFGIGDPGYIYVLKARSTNRYKFGFTRSSKVERRIKELQTASPFTLDLVTSIKSLNPEAIESAMHRYLSDYRVSGEWFELDEDALGDAMRALYAYGDQTQ